MYSSVSAQDFSCGTVTPATPLNYSSLVGMQDARPELEELCLNVAFHIVTATTSTGANHGVDVHEIIERLNEDYASTNISFTMNYNGQKEAVDIIRNSNYLDILERGNSDPYNFDNLVTINHDPNAINVYLVDRMHTIFNDEVQGRGLILSRRLVIMKSAAVKPVISHEVGHCLNLYHTHEEKFGIGANDNCTYAGDLVCDTPPDHKLSNGNYVSDKCEYQNGEAGYKPDTRNIMSYSLEKCLEHFSVGQAVRMQDAILHNQNLKKAINCNCTNNPSELIGSSNICVGVNEIYTILCPVGVAYFEVENLQIISSTNNTVTVRNSSVVNGKAVIRAIMNNGEVFEKYIWIGRPAVYLKMKTTTNVVFMELRPSSSDFDTQDISYIEWHTISSTGSAYMSKAINKFENEADGSGAWTIEARIEVANKCNTSFWNQIIIPKEDPCGREYEVNKSQEKEFAIFKITNPCRTEGEAQKEKVKNEDIKRAVLLDSFGNEIRTYQENNFNVENIKEGVYIFKIQVNNGLITQKIIIE